MRTSELSHLARLIDSRIHQLQGKLDSFSAEHDEQSPLEQKAMQAVDKAMVEKAETEMARLAINLEWLQSDDGGYCDGCGEQIPIARLEAVPTTRYCVRCASQFDTQAS